MPYTPIWISWPLKQISLLGNCRIFNKFSLSKKTSKTMKEGGPSFGKIFFRNVPARDFIFKVIKVAHWGHHSPPRHHEDQGGGAGEVQEECGGWWRWFGWRESEGRVGAIYFYFPQPLAFFGFSPHNFLIRAKMHKSRKMTKGGTNDPILTHPVWGHWGGEPDGGGWVVVFLLGGWTLTPRRKLKLN